VAVASYEFRTRTIGQCNVAKYHDSTLHLCGVKRAMWERSDIVVCMLAEVWILVVRTYGLIHSAITGSAVCALGALCT
jgi:hypothetical protein